jgi:hypothetical protein
MNPDKIFAGPELARPAPLLRSGRVRRMQPLRGRVPGGRIDSQRETGSSADTSVPRRMLVLRLLRHGMPDGGRETAPSPHEPGAFRLKSDLLDPKR